MTACSWTSSKSDHYDDGDHAILRVSAGRVDDRRWLYFDESVLVEVQRRELALTIDLRGEGVTRVTPWRRSLPQYLPACVRQWSTLGNASVRFRRVAFRLRIFSHLFNLFQYFQVR